MSEATPKNHKRVRFIRLDDPDLRIRDQIICRLVEGFYHEGQTVLLRVDDISVHHIDEALWARPGVSFLPHAVLPCQDTSIHPILLSTQDCEITGIDVLIVATAECELQWMTQFSHIIDFAAVFDEHLRELSRKRFKQWRTLGHNPEFEQQS